jgi:poly(hydroxyalkanoate) depolymerase family esterase
MNDLAEAHRLLVAYPGQATRDNANACWNWFRPQDQDRGRGEPAIIAGITREIAGEFNVPDNRIFVAGLSAGGAMAAVLGETYPDLFAAVGVHSGLATGLASDVASAFAAMRGGRTGPGRTGPAPTRGPDAPRLIVFHGTADTTVHPENAVRIAQLRAGTAPDPVPGDPADPRRPTTRHIQHGPDGQPRTELWMIEGAGHAWSGGRSAGSYTDPEGPDASAAMIRFFLADR